MMFKKVGARLNLQNDTCIQERRRSACVSAYSDQSSVGTSWVVRAINIHAEYEISDHTVCMCRLICVFAGIQLFSGMHVLAIKALTQGRELKAKIYKLSNLPGLPPPPTPRS